jgi:hypothetical protein
MTYAQIPPPDHDLFRRFPLVGLPEYRFVPKLFPHPTKSEDGHSFNQTSHLPQSRKERQRCWGFGLDLFDYRYYWEAHECWENLWRIYKGKEREGVVLQGMIQLSASILKRHMGHSLQADKLFQRASALLSLPTSEEWHGLDIPASLLSVSGFHSLREWPLLVMNDQCGWQNWP